MAAPLLPRVYDEDENAEWENKVHQILQEELGRETYKDRLEGQFKDVPELPGGAMSGLGMRLQIRRSVRATRHGFSPPKPVGGAGFATVTTHPKFPANDFFRPGRHFRVRLRHANMSCDDDRSRDGRVVALKFCDEDEAGPLDLVLHTGRVAPAHSAASLNQLLTAMATGEDALQEHCHNHPASYYGLVDQARHLPSSYYDLRYYGHVTYQLMDREGIRHMARLRLCPASGEEETGRISEDAQRQVWCALKDEDPTKSPDYLRTEYMTRLQRGALQYRLQIQTRPWPVLTTAPNPCLKWNPHKHLWHDLAMITIALLLPQTTVCRTKVSLLNHPKTVFRLPSPANKHDFLSFGHAMSDLHSQYHKPEVGPEPKRKYLIKVVTGKAGDAGTDADVHVVITGTKSRTRSINLDTKFHDDFESGQTDVFEREGVDVGEVVMVKMSLTSVIPGRHWLLDHVTVSDVGGEKTAYFPCDQWLSSSQPSICLRRSEALLAHQEKNTYCYLQRKYELEQRRESYQWERVQGLPSQLKADHKEDIPREARLHHAKYQDLKVRYLQSLASTGAGTIKSMFDAWDPLTDHEKLLTGLLKDKSTVKKISIRWKDDVEFGRQVLNGPHPVRLQRLQRPLMAFPVKDEDVYGLLDRGMTLGNEIKEGHVYLLTYPELAGLIPQPSPPTAHYLASPMCMLYVRSDGCLVPIAIQLTHRPGLTPVIFTPRDNRWEWVYAKMWVRLADTQIHHIEARHLRLHLVLEAFAVSTLRNLPAVHPVHKLLIPHIRHAPMASRMARHALQGDGGLFEKAFSVGGRYLDLLKESYRHFQLKTLSVPCDLAARGVDNTTLLPNYHYGHDALALWGIIKKLVRTLLTLHYWTKERVKGDEEVQAWVRDLHINGFPVWEDGTGHGVPSRVDSLDELIELVTSVIFTATGYNAAVTAPIMDYYGFPPNSPTVLVQPPPSQKGEVKADTLQSSLPGRTQTAEVLAICHALCGTYKDKSHLGTFPNWHFSEEATLAVIDAFRDDLQNLIQTIVDRNAHLEFPYPYLCPDRVPDSLNL